MAWNRGDVDPNVCRNPSLTCQPSLAETDRDEPFNRNSENFPGAMIARTKSGMPASTSSVP